MRTRSYIVRALFESAWLWVFFMTVIPDSCNCFQLFRVHQHNQLRQIRQLHNIHAIIEPSSSSSLDDEENEEKTIESSSSNSIARPEIVRPKDRGGVAEKMLIVYTCKVCNTRNSQEISKIAYQEGIVVSKCSNCKTSHLVADNTGKLDMAEYGKKIDTYLESKGETVQRLVLTPEQLEENYLIDRNGKIELHNKEGGQPQVDSRIIDWVYKKKEQRIQERLQNTSENEENDGDEQTGSEGPALLP